MASMTQQEYGAGVELPPEPEPEEVDVSTGQQTVELEILATVYDQAMVRAHSQGQKLAAVARAILYQEAAKTPADAPEVEGRPPLREYGQKRKPLKFRLPRDRYAEAQNQIARGGRSVAAAVEDGLRVFARTGNL